MSRLIRGESSAEQKVMLSAKLRDLREQPLGLRSRHAQERT
jgi:hypothetical protein